MMTDKVECIFFFFILYQTHCDPMQPDGELTFLDVPVAKNAVEMTYVNRKPLQFLVFANQTSVVGF